MNFDIPLELTSYLTELDDFWVKNPWNYPKDQNLSAFEPNRVYQNVGGTWTPTWSSTELELTTSLAWADAGGAPV